MRATPRQRPFNRDRLMVINRSDAAYAAHEQLASTNARPPEEQIAATAVLFAAHCQRFGLDPEEMHRLGRKLLTPQPFQPKANAQVSALEDYATAINRGHL